MPEVSKGIAALRLSGERVVKMSENGDTFYFKPFTIQKEIEVNGIFEAHRATTPRRPEEPKADEEGNVSEEVLNKYYSELNEYNSAAQKETMALMADLMKATLVDEKGNPFFAQEDDIVSYLTNVYVANFQTCFTKFRSGDFGGSFRQTGK